MNDSRKKNFLLISYLFPPIGGSGSLRPLRVVQHLEKHHWNPIVLTVKNPDWYYAQDQELLEGFPEDIPIFRTRMLRSAWIYRCLNPFRINRVDRYIRSYLIHPDEQIGWLPLACKKACEIVEKNDVSVVYSTSGPYTNHLIALLLKRRFGIPWIAEFRDEWFEDPALPLPTILHRKLHWHLEKTVVETADRIVTMAPEFNRFLLKHGIPSEKIHTIPKGFEMLEHRSKRETSYKNNQCFTVVYAGLIYDTFPPDRFLTAVNALIAEGEIPPQEVRIRFVGAISVSEKLNQFGNIECTGFMPRSKALEEVLKADLLLLLLSRERGAGVIPSKIFEYMASGRPILALVPPESTVAGMIQETKTGFVADYYDFEEIKKTFLKLYHLWKLGQLQVSPDRSKLDKYNQKTLFAELASILDALARI